MRNVFLLAPVKVLWAAFFTLLCLAAWVGLMAALPKIPAHAASIGAEPPPDDEAHYVVEVALRVDGRWYRLNTGPRPNVEALGLWRGLGEVLREAGVPHQFVLLNMDNGTVEIPTEPTDLGHAAGY